MILLELKHYIKQHQRVTLNDIQLHFDLSEEAAKGLLAPLLQQGHIHSQQSDDCTSQTCHKNCSGHHTQHIIYQWRDKAFKQVAVPIQIT